MNQQLRGVIVPAATPFDESGMFRPDWFERNVERWRTTKVGGLMCLGTNGEFRSLDDKESRMVVAAAAAAAGDLTLIVGVGRESTHHTLSFIDTIAQHDAVDYVSVLPPHYFAKAMTPQALLRYFTDVADRSPKPVLIYVAPGYANGVVVPPATVAELAGHPNIAGIKDTSNDQLTAYMLATYGRDDFSVMAGTMNTVLTMAYLGGTCCVVSASNYFPNECADVLQLALDGHRDAAIDAYAQLQILIQETGGKRGVASLKSCMNQLGYHGGIPRAPLSPLTAAEDEAIGSALRRAGKAREQ